MSSPGPIGSNGTRVLATAIAVLGVAMVARTLIAGGSVLSIGVLARWRVLCHRPRAPLPGDPGRPVSERRAVKPPLGRRFLGVPWLWAVAHSAIAFSIYYSLGVVAESGLALTPVIFGVAGLVYVVTTMTYVEGGAMFRERGGSNTLARHAFNELVSFIAGWAILIDYVIVIALAAISVPHYLAPISTDLSSGTGEIAIGVGVVALVCVVNIVGYTGHRRQGWLVALTAADVFLQFALIVIGIAVVWDPSALTSELHMFGTPSVGDIALALVISMSRWPVSRPPPIWRPTCSGAARTSSTSCGRAASSCRSSTSGWRWSR